MPRLDASAVGVTSVVGEPALTSHQLLCDTSPGAPLHSLFEGLDFTQPTNPNWVQKKLELGDFEPQWKLILTGQIIVALQASLNETGASLNQFPDHDKRVEMEFYLSISESLIAGQLDALIRQFSLLFVDCLPLGFMQAYGILGGLIDLVFHCEGYYYPPDYKSNWLGRGNSTYTQRAMAAVIQVHRYDLQYQLYTPTLHCYSRHRIVDYDCERRFDGVIYLLLCDVDKEYP